mmetsp:Transcript_12899/g.23746  ORF Transcript_12899/g.23746 Transcript_12899/m.23746 type:complete len:512 (+) Transcript_12899:157-1692(+)|eukprot:CAMPEP_0201884664 /NCGR_PEP_ID=MMETSP0902-20130614/17484_1 /ASSEMBLY_ACC=CAM_ASM_000551 /TAXON_ID=420261 /ORGANISM="Thalassiosira antarctica, Strain CCMP982" /LENGTH=511 /DNA_ID=CAMNT_0048413661 /DNA_START=127 /DNA_END=1662 /DNA_ORIENTATION=-
MSKRKASPVDDDDSADNHQTLFTSVPDECWNLVSSFASPPSVYNLALSSKHFFRSIGEDETVAAVDPPSSFQRALDMGFSAPFLRDKTEQELEALLSRNKGNARGAGASSTATPLLATRLLRQSLLSSLGRVLEHSQTGITLESALALANLPKGSAIIAGSTMAQTCLGVLWEGGRYSPVDVDVYCSATAAPQVRSWLVEQASGIFVGFKDSYVDSTDNRLSYTVDTKIHHVEHWGSLAQNIDENMEGKEPYGSSTKSVADLNKEGAGISIETLKSTEYYKKAVGWGKNCQKNYANWKWKPFFTILGVDQSKAYDIKPKPRGDLPFDFNGEGDIDLIVARTKNSPFDLLEDFDLTICKASFDGKTFRIPDPHNTFSGRSTMEPNRKKVVESYVKHYVPGNRHHIGMGASVFVSAVVEKVRKDVPRAPFYRQLDVAAMLPDRYDPDAFFGRGSVYDEFVQAKHGASIMFHNWTFKLIKRLHKYQTRGIEVIGAPTIGDDFEISELSLQSHGG